MKRLFFFLLLLIALLTIQSMVSAQEGVQTGLASDDHTAREEKEGKEIWEKLQAKQLGCKELTDDRYVVLGEYFMGQSIGDTQRHAAMNQMMISMMGEKGEKQMHIVMGKRLSGCDTSAQIPANDIGFMPMMMGIMRGGGNNMMSGWGGFGLLGWIPMVLFWIVLILGVVALLRYLGRSGQQQDDKTPLEILKERYAKGEIDKKKFEEMKKEVR